MRQATLGLYYVVKYAELTFLIIWTSLIFSSSFWFADVITGQSVLEDKDTQCIIFTIATLVLIVFNLFYNNLLINLRFYCKMNCVTFGKCIFDVINYLFCYCFLVKPCRDRCFTPWTVVKWLIKAAVIGYTIYLVQDKKTRWADGFEVGTLARDPGTSRLDIYLMVYLLQHPIFIIARLPTFLLYSILTCCCDKGDDINEGNEFRDRVLSFDFIEFELGRLNNFENHPVGRNEWEYNRRLSFVRQQSMRAHQPAAPAMSQSIIQRV